MIYPNKLRTLFMLPAFIFLLAACSTTPKGDEAMVGDAKEVDSTAGTEIYADTASSRIGFTGNGVGKNHPGYFKLSSGFLKVADGKVVGGNFVIDTRSLKLDQQEEMFQTKLKGHLLGADFFDVEKFPTAQFEITSVEPYQNEKGDSSLVEGANSRINGNFTLKGVAKNVSFPARLDTDGKTFSAKANFNIDRTLWGLNYGNDKSLKDKFISEIVNIQFDVKGKP